MCHGLKPSPPTHHQPTWLVATLLATFLHAAAGADVHSALDTAFAPDGKTLAVTDATTPSVVLVDPVKPAVLRTVKLAGPPSGLAWSADGKNLFAA